MNTMFRCTFRGAAAALALAAVAGFATSAAAQVQRAFPQNALRGAIVMSSPPDITLNGQPARLAPGVRVRNQANMLEMTGALVGQRLLVNYTVEINGLINNVWILRPEEAAVRPWPTTLEEAQTWTFDPAAQTWTKP
jgi:hypothetical protein